MHQRRKVSASARIDQDGAAKGCTLSRRPTHPRQEISVAQESLRFVLKEMPDQLDHLHIVILYADNGFKDS